MGVAYNFFTLRDTNSYMAFHYTNRSVLLESTPLVKFILNNIRDPGDVFSVSLYTSEDIDEFTRYYHV